MYFCIHEHVVVKYYSFEMNKEKVRYQIQNISFCRIRPFTAVLTKAVRYKFACIHPFQCSVKIVLSLNFNTVGEKLLNSLSFGSATMTYHLSYLIPLKKFIQYIFIRCLPKTIFELIKQKIQELGRVLLYRWVDGRYKWIQKIFRSIFNSFWEEQEWKKWFELVY